MCLCFRDYDKLDPLDIVGNCSLAFDVAESKLGIPSLLGWKIISRYTSFWLKFLLEHYKYFVFRSVGHGKHGMSRQIVRPHVCGSILLGIQKCGTEISFNTRQRWKWCPCRISKARQEGNIINMTFTSSLEYNLYYEFQLWLISWGIKTVIFSQWYKGGYMYGLVFLIRRLTTLSNYIAPGSML